MRIGLLSDTHSALDSSIYKYFSKVDEIWHAGDVGDPKVLDQLKDFKPTIAVYGNIDNKEIRLECPEFAKFEREGLKILMTHIAGKPPKYNRQVREEIKTFQPGLLVCGHSHLLKVMPDHQNQLLFMNPGAAGNHGFHKVKTLIRFEIHSGKMHNAEVIEIGKRGAIPGNQ